MLNVCWHYFCLLFSKTCNMSFYINLNVIDLFLFYYLLAFKFRWASCFPVFFLSFMFVFLSVCIPLYQVRLVLWVNLSVCHSFSWLLPTLTRLSVLGSKRDVCFWWSREDSVPVRRWVSTLVQPEINTIVPPIIFAWRIKLVFWTGFTSIRPSSTQNWFCRKMLCSKNV